MANEQLFSNRAENYAKGRLGYAKGVVDLLCNEILKPDGILFTVINARDYSDPFTVRQHEICKNLCPNFSSLRHGLDKSVPQFERLFGHNLNHAEFDFPLEYTKERFVQRSLSSSYAPQPNTKEYEKNINKHLHLLTEGDNVL